MKEKVVRDLDVLLNKNETMDLWLNTNEQTYMSRVPE